MSGTVLENTLVRFYLRRLDAACVALPVARARELRDQIAAHLDEALPPGATDAQVRAELARLGTPAVLAAEAAGPAARSARARLRGRLARVRGWAWVSIALALALLAPAVTYVTVVDTAEPLSSHAGGPWWYRQDNNAPGTMTTAGGFTEFAVPERYGQRQGFIVDLSNTSDRVQTILGLDSATWMFPRMDMTVGVGVGTADGNWTHRTRWAVPVAIPPQSYVPIRVLWTSNFCLPAGDSFSIWHLPIRVRVGLFTRTEDVQLEATWKITGTKASAAAGGCR